MDTHQSGDQRRLLEADSVGVQYWPVSSIALLPGFAGQLTTGIPRHAKRARSAEGGPPIRERKKRKQALLLSLLK